MVKIGGLLVLGYREFRYKKLERQNCIKNVFVFHSEKKNEKILAAIN